MNQQLLIFEPLSHSFFDYNMLQLRKRSKGG